MHYLYLPFYRHQNTVLKTMSKSLAATTLPHRKSNKIAYYGILFAFALALAGSIQNLERETVFSFIPLAILTTLIGCSFTLVLTGKTNSETLISPLLIGLNAFGLFVLFSALYSKYPLLTASRSLQFILVSNCLYIMLSYIRDLEEIFKKISELTIAFTFIASVYGIIIYHFGNAYSSDGIWVTGLKSFGLEFTQRMFGERIASFTGNPNIFGVRIMVSILTCLYFLKKYRQKRFILLILFFLYTLFLTGSRASALGLLGGAAFYLNYSYLKNNFGAAALRVLLISVCFAFGAYLLVSPEFIKDIFSLIGRESSSLSGREVAWATLFEQITKKPYLGIGYKISTEAILEDNFINVSNSHNLYLSILSEVGLVGFLLFAYIYIYPVLRFLVTNQKSKRRPLQLITTSILTSLLINQFFENMFSPFNYVFIYILFATFITRSQQNSKASSSTAMIR